MVFEGANRFLRYAQHVLRCQRFPRDAQRFYYYYRYRYSDPYRFYYRYRCCYRYRYRT